MKIKSIYVSFLISGIALAFSVISLCNSRPRSLGIDYLGIIVGSLALIVTALIGWQVVHYIYSASAVNNQINKAVVAVAKDFSLITEGYTFLSEARIEHYLGYKHDAIECCFTAISQFQSCEDKSLSKDCLDNACSTLVSFLTDYKESGEILLRPNRKDAYLHIAHTLNKHQSQRILHLLNDAKEDANYRRHGTLEKELAKI